MKASELRTAFKISWWSDSADYDQQLLTHLMDKEFKVRTFVEYKDFTETLENSTPHAVLLNFEDTAKAEKTVKDIQAVSSEVQIVVLSPVKSLFEAQKLYASGVNIVLAWPLVGNADVVATLDRIVEKNYYMFLSEQLIDENNVFKMQIKKDPLVPIDDWSKSQLQKKDIHTATEHFLQAVKGQFENVRAIFFKYVPHRQSLVITHQVGVGRDDLQNLGIDLGRLEGDFRKERLLNPNSLTSLKDFSFSILDEGSAHCIPVYGHEGVEGVIMFLGAGAKLLVESKIFQSFFRIYQLHAEKLVLQKKYHSVNLFDEVSFLLNRQTFLKRLSEEVSRARRLNLPTSLVLVQLGEVADPRMDESREEFDIVIRMLAGVLKKNSRANDIVGRVGTHEFGLILPHTPHSGAAIKAQRLRQILPTTQFQKVIGFNIEAQFSLGISEYPTFCSDADDLWATSDEALYTAEKEGQNKICLARAPQGFVPDFKVTQL